MEEVLEELRQYYQARNPREWPLYEEYNEAAHKFYVLEERLRGTLTPEQAELFAEYETAREDLFEIYSQMDFLGGMCAAKTVLQQIFPRAADASRQRDGQEISPLTKAWGSAPDRPALPAASMMK